MSAMFQELLTMANSQEQPQRLLFLFAQAEAKNPKKSKKLQKGHLTPVMCVDKLPEQLTDYKDLVAEADDIEKKWNFVFIAGLSGENGVAPSEEAAEPYLNQMTNNVLTGQSIANYVVFDREGNPMELLAS